MTERVKYTDLHAEGPASRRSYLTNVFNLLCRSFDEGELRTICFNLGIDYDNLEGAGKANKARELLVYLERRARTHELIEICSQQRPRLSWYGSASQTPPGTRQQRTLKAGLEALIDLMRTPGVRDAVATFRTDLHATHERVNVLIYFKDLHDLLHTLHYRCYIPIVRESRIFPDEDIAHENLADYELTLRETVRELRDVLARSPAMVYETTWINDLTQSADILRHAIEASDRHLLRRAVWFMNRVLATQPSYINANLIATARTLPLPGLLSALRRLHTLLGALELDPEKLQQFATGVTALVQRGLALRDLVNEHDAWQTIDRELRRIEASLDHDTVELEMSWTYVKAKVERLCGTGSDEWIVALRNDCTRLEGALTSPELSRIKPLFLRFHRQAGNRFYRVDTNLKRLCDSLREFRDPLTELQRVVDE